MRCCHPLWISLLLGASSFFIACEEDGGKSSFAPGEPLPPLSGRDERLPLAPLDQGGGPSSGDDQGNALSDAMVDGLEAPADQGGDRAADEADGGVDDQGGLSGPWQRTRPCDQLLRVDAPGAREVLIAGDFTEWGRSPIPLQAVGSGWFEGRFGEAEGLQSGVTHGYKLIIDGRWQIDRRAALRVTEGGCTNSGLRLPECARPLLEDESLTLQLSGTGDALRAQLEATLSFSSGTPWSPPERWRVLLDGEELGEESFELDPEGGQIHLRWSDLQAGKHWLSVQVWDALGRESLPRRLPFWVESSPSSIEAGAIYLLFLDRFANGDQSNDGSAGTPIEGLSWHGGDLQGAIAALESGYFESLGVSAIWLSPLYAQAGGALSGPEHQEREGTAYHGYWPIRGREVEPRFGGEAALERFIIEAHARGIRVLLDLVQNQIHEEHEYYQSNPEWFRDGCVCGTPGCGWSERPLECLFESYLPDIDWRVPEAEERFLADALWWLERFDVDGFRVDAVKHLEAAAVFNLRAAIDARFGKHSERPLLLGETAVSAFDRYDDCGEIYQTGYEWIEAYTGPYGLDGQFDFPTHHRIRWQLLSGEGDYREVASALEDQQRRYRPDAHHVLFLGSHDSNRVASEAARDPEVYCALPSDPGCSDLPAEVEGAAIFQRLKRAWLLLWTNPHIPLLYYGDEIALPGGLDPDSRRPMRWEGALAALGEIGAASPLSLSPDQLDLRAHFQALGALRRQHPVLYTGEREILASDRNLLSYAFSNEDARLLVALSQADEPQRLSFPRDQGDQEMPALILGEGTLTLEGDRWQLTLPSGAFAVYQLR
ncbi:MAG: alpha-amylase family glycosyl hydrolase [Myxococcota bacterium]|nr:alpha-amylase family glycosyl hydrolase [Myxococcota bacterium]